MTATSSRRTKEKQPHPVSPIAAPSATGVSSAEEGRPQLAARQPSGPGEVIGEVVWLMTQSVAHKHLFVSDLDWLLVPPVMAKQFRLFRNGDKPRAFACWAYLDEEAEKRLLSGQPRLRPGEWHGGDRAWLIDVIAPFGGLDSVLANLKQTEFKDRRLMAMRPSPDGKGMVAFEVSVEAKAA